MQDINIEKKVIAKILMKEEDTDLFFAELDKDCFSSTLTKKIYDTMLKLYMAGDKISPISVARKTAGKGRDLEEIAEYNTLGGDFEEYIKILKQYKKRRELQKKANQIADLARDENLDLQEYQNKAEEIIFDGESEDKDGIHTLEESLQDLYMELQGEVEKNYLKTGYPSLDRKIGGLIPSHLTVLAGPTSMGKTAFALSLIYNVLKNEKKVIFISLEMTHTEITQRLLVQDSRVPTDRYRKALKGADKKNVDVALGRLMNYNMTISDDRGLSTTDIKARCRRIARNMEGVDLIVVDYLQNIAIDDQKYNHAKAVGLAVNELRNLSGELDCPLLLLSQVNRGRDGVPRLSDLRDSGEIEEAADEVWFPYRPEYDKDKNKQNVKDREDASLIMAKGRTTGVGRVGFVWYADILRWRDAYVDQQEGGLAF